MDKTVGDGIVDTLAGVGARQVFGVACNALTDAMRCDGRIGWVVVRHEEGDVPRVLPANEDWKGTDALRMLDRHKGTILSCNDRIQGTAGIVLAFRVRTLPRRVLPCRNALIEPFSHDKRRHYAPC